LNIFRPFHTPEFSTAIDVASFLVVGGADFVGV